jgi:hypothetical protein
MRAFNLVVLFLLNFPGWLMAQQDTIVQRDVTYFNQISSGILFGKKFTGNTVTVSAIHGVRLGRLSCGVGVGYETYSEREVMPVFVSLAVDLVSSEAHKVFIEIDYGYSKAWHVSSPFDPYTYRERGGRMLHGSVGYRRKIDRFSLYVKAGYKNQLVKYDQVVWWMPEQVGHVHRDMERVSLGIGFGLN